MESSFPIEYNNKDKHLKLLCCVAKNLEIYQLQLDSNSLNRNGSVKLIMKSVVNNNMDPATPTAVEETHRVSIAALNLRFLKKAIHWGFIHMTPFFHELSDDGVIFERTEKPLKWSDDHNFSLRYQFGNVTTMFCEATIQTSTRDEYDILLKVR